MAITTLAPLRASASKSLSRSSGDASKMYGSSPRKSRVTFPLGAFSMGS